MATGAPVTINTNNIRSHTLAWAMSLSISCHLLLLWGSAYWEEADQPPRLASPLSYQVRIGESELVTPKKVANRQMPVEKTRIPRQALARPVDPVSANSRTIQEHTRETAQTDENEQLAQAQLQVLSYLQDRISNHFVYPRLARRNGWEGKVILRVDIESDGIISNIRLLSSSGYAILDESAIEALAQVHSITRLPKYTGTLSLYVDVPIIYHLKQG